MRFISKPSEQEWERIVDALESWDDPEEVRRLRAISMSIKDFTVPEIAKALNVTRWAVRQWFDAYEEEGLSSLRTEPRPGRPPKADQQYMNLLRETVETQPRDLGYCFSSWTREYLARHMEKKTGVQISPAHMGRLLNKLDFTYKRARHDLSHRRDEELFEEKKTQINGLKKKPEALRRSLI